MSKLQKHKELDVDYEKAKSKQLEKLATKLLKAQEANDKLKEKVINKDILNLF